jgi:hypothetical protein
MSMMFVMLPNFDLAETLKKSAIQIERYPNGALRSCIPLEPFRVRYGDHLLVAQYQEEPPRRIVVPQVEFHSNGKLKDITLQTPTHISTELGALPAERITFYDDGRLCRVFSTAGKPNATWTEEDEMALSPKQNLTLPTGQIEARFIGICFFPSSKVRSVTLWPKEVVPVSTPLGSFPARIGIAFHENGLLRAFEPARTLDLPTPLGIIPAFHALAVGIHGDSGSVEFTDNGALKALLTDDCRILVRSKNGEVIATHEPKEILSRCEESATERLPMNLSFNENSFSIDGKMYALNQCDVTIERPNGNKRKLPMICGC